MTDINEQPNKTQMSKLQATRERFANSRLAKEKVSAVYLAPNLVTTAALMFGFFAILASIKQDFDHAAVCIFVAMLLDGMDGRVARFVGGESAFGEQYDSLSDLLSFGVAPAILIYQWSISTAAHISWLPERLSWVVPFIYCACAALRLARFNVQIGSIDARFFIGLPSPAAAATVAGFVWVGTKYDIVGADVVFFAIVITLYAGCMMIAPIKFFSFKKLDLKGKIPFFAMILLVLILALIAIHPATVLWTIFLIYSSHGPIRKAYRVYNNKPKKI